MVSKAKHCECIVLILDGTVVEMFLTSCHICGKFVSLMVELCIHAKLTIGLGINCLRSDLPCRKKIWY